MELAEALSIIRKGAEKGEFNQERIIHSGVSLAGSDLSGLKLRGISLVGIDLCGVDLTGADLSRANLIEANLEHANLEGAILHNALLRSAQLGGANLSKCDCSRADFQKANLKESDLRDAIFVGANLSHCDLSLAKIAGTSFERCNLENARLSSVIIGRPVNAIDDPHRPNFTRAILRHATIRRADLRESLFTHANLNSASFSTVLLGRCHLSGTNWKNAWLHGVSLSEAVLTGATFHNATVRDCALHEVVVDQATNLREVKTIEGTSIDRFTLETMIGQDVIKPGQRMVMDVYDDVARLRLAFSGYYRWTHILALALFLLPYAWFVAVNHLRALAMGDDQPSELLVIALLRYICSGRADWGSGWHFQWYPMTLFALALTFNILRFQLLWKTNELEHAERVTTIPQRWSLRTHPYWNFAFGFSKWALRLFVLIAILRFVLFLWEPVPIPE